MTTIVAKNNMTSYIPYFSDTECFTRSGPETGEKCAFPFTYQGETYETCTEVDDDQLWCSTEVDHNGVHVRGKWGYCDNECNLGKTLIFPVSNHQYLMSKKASGRLEFNSDLSSITLKDCD